VHIGPKSSSLSLSLLLAVGKKKGEKKRGLQEERKKGKEGRLFPLFQCSQQCSGGGEGKEGGRGRSTQGRKKGV